MLFPQLWWQEQLRHVVVATLYESGYFAPFKPRRKARIAAAIIDQCAITRISVKRDINARRKANNPRLSFELGVPDSEAMAVYNTF